MPKIETLVFNPFQVNTYVIYDDTKECVIIDPACYGRHEEQQLADFIKKNGLKPLAVLYTHCHVDHILGNNFVCREYGLTPLVHPDSLQFLQASVLQGQVYGFEVEEPILPESFLEEGQVFTFGNQKLELLLVPGHAAGSLCLYHREEGFVVVGDVLFYGSIGRTDLPTGDMELLLSGISSKLFTLPDMVTVYPGHGPETSIGFEKENNPFF